MGTNTKSVVRWLYIVGYLAIPALILACMGVAVGTSHAEQGALQLNDGVVEVVDENGDPVPVAGTSTFELVGTLESTDPWKVADRVLETNASTQIADGLQTGDLVRVRGTILENDTWLAYSIERVEEQTNPTIILIGKVTSVDPWVVNGITLNVTSDTVITGDIKPGMIVRLEILLAADGTWEVLSIAPLGSSSEIPGCVTVTATVVTVNGNQIQLEGWPEITLGEDVKIESGEGGEGTLAANQTVLVVVCASENGQITITQIIILNSGEQGSSADGEKVLICHKPNKNGGHTLSVAAAAVPAHLGHGDTLGPCP